LNDAEKLKQLQDLIRAEITWLGLSDFDVEDGGPNTILISRAGHVHASWTVAAGRCLYTQAGYGAPTFTTLDVGLAVAHTLRSLAKSKST
jgi:hypothetical protein